MRSVATRYIYVLVGGLWWAGCGLEVTNEIPSYADLDGSERAAVDLIVGELQQLEARVRSDSISAVGRAVDLSPIVDRERINVAFEGQLFTFNFGNGIVHIPAWENLDAAQQKLVGDWFGAADSASARASYVTFFYRYMALTHGMKQYMYNLVSVENAYKHKYIFTLELDSARSAVSHLDAAGRQNEIAAVRGLCTPVLAARSLNEAYGSMFTAAQSTAKPLRFPLAKRHVQDNWQSLADPDDPTHYMYFLCRAFQIGTKERRSFGAELTKIYKELDF